MPRKLFIAAAVLLGAAAANAQTEEYIYSVHYRWGLIDTDIATGTVTATVDGNEFHGRLDGHSIVWDGRVYMVSAVLDAIMEPSRSATGINERVTYECGLYAKPTESQWADGDFEPTRESDYRTTLGSGTLDASPETMEAVQTGTDILGMFYVFKHLDYAVLPVGKTMTVPVSLPDGSVLYYNLTYNGTDTFDGRTVYDTTVEYYYNGAPSGYPVQCLVSQATGVPLSISAQLKIGHMQMVLE